MYEYTISLLFWIVPVIGFSIFFIVHRTLKPIPLKAVTFNLCILSAIGFLLDLVFAKMFFTFPDPRRTMGIALRGIPIEEFAFYLFGFCFIILFYVFNDEYFLLKYNVPDTRYARYARLLRQNVYVSITFRSALVFLGLCGTAIAIKQVLNPAHRAFLPGYFIFLAAVAYVPWIFFWRVTKQFINQRALVFTILATLCISIIWEVTLALPRGYWNYNPDYMVGIFIHAWCNLPIEAITVWVFCSLIVLSYEYTKLLLHRSQGRKRKSPMLLIRQL